MRVFTYTYETEDGKRGTGTIEANTFEEVIDYIATLTEGVYLTHTEITPIK